MDTQKHLCNNCGNYGHLFYNCRKPITSFGIIAFKYSYNENDNIYDTNNALKNIIRPILTWFGIVDFNTG